MITRLLVVVSIVGMISGCSKNEPVDSTSSELVNPVWKTQYSDSTGLFIGMSIVNEQIVWVSGEPNIVGKTTDGGETWDVKKVTDVDSLMLRDVHAFSKDEAIVSSLGPGNAARLYRTTNGGDSWEMVLQESHPDRWFVCFSFWDKRGFMAVSSDQGLIVMKTMNRGVSWNEIAFPKGPALIPGEHAVAASGTCSLAGINGNGWITTRIPGTGTRVWRTTDYGDNWTAHSTTVPSGREGEGLASAAFFNSLEGIAIGRVDSKDDSNTAITSDGGITWTKGGRAVGGVVFGASVVPGTSTPTLVAVSRDFGSQYSIDGGQTWTDIGDENFWTVSFLNANAGWAAGKGRISKIANSTSKNPDL